MGDSQDCDLGNSTALPASPPAVSPPAGAESLGGPRDQTPPARAWSPVVVRDWFDIAAEVAIRDYDGSLGTARSAAAAYARRGARVVRLVRPRSAAAAYARRGARVVRLVRPERFALPARARVRRGRLPRRRARPFLPVNTVELRRAAIRYLHVIAGCAVPTAEAYRVRTSANRFP
jgi:hypothetical protein